MYGILRATCGSNPLGVDDENEFQNALNTNQIYEWNRGHVKYINMNSYESPFIF